MLPSNKIPAPVLFNPLKHHLGYIREFIELNSGTGEEHRPEIVRELKHIGGSVMDVYLGNVGYDEIGAELLHFVIENNLSSAGDFLKWAGNDPNEFRSVNLSDGSVWVMKYHCNENRFVHCFPARFSPSSIRIKANTLKSAILYQIFIGKDYLSEEDLNTARAIGGLSPVRDIFDTEAITEMIEILRG